MRTRNLNSNGSIGIYYFNVFEIIIIVFVFIIISENKLNY